MIFRKSIFVKMFTNLAIVLVLFGLIVILGMQIFTSISIRNIARQALRASANQAETVYIGGDYVKLQEIAERTNTSIIVIADNQRIVAGDLGTFPITRDEFVESRGGMDFYREHSSNEKGERVAEYMLGVLTKEGYTIEVRQSLQGRAEILSAGQTMTRVFILAAFLLSLGWAVAYSRIFTRPITQMNRVAKDMAQLDFSNRIHIENSDEMGQLASSINDISKSLSAALGELSLKNKQLTEELEKARGLDEMRKRFVSDVSHELKTPLAIIQGYAEALSMSADKISDTRVADKTIKYSTSIIDESQRMNKLVLDLLSLTTYQSGSYHLKLQDVAIDELITSICQKLGQTKAADGVCMEVDAAKYTVVCDPDRMEQVLTNLVSNAISHADVSKEVRVSGIATETGYEIVVFNSGAHIGEQDLENIWTPFFRGDNSRSREGGRYGIGLSIVKALLDLHGAEYGARNVEKGVEFFIRVGRTQLATCCAERGNDVPFGNEITA